MKFKDAAYEILKEADRQHPRNGQGVYKGKYSGQAI
jgi:hypothetical protein